MSTPKPPAAENVIEKIPSQCFEVMKSPVHSVSERASVQTAARMMREHDVGFLPVCHEHGPVLGILTDRDIATRLCAENEDAAHTRVSHVMTRGVITCHPEDALAKAERLMREHQITRIVITDALRKAVGVLSLSDIAQYESPTRLKRTLQTIAKRKYAPQRP
jgi:CBS domain-containing protein